VNTNNSKLPKKVITWLFEVSFIDQLPWDLGKWHWFAITLIGDVPFFGHLAKRGYLSHYGHNLHMVAIMTFIL
jgi:hypothetical protein